nr:hypothetical protein [Tanacetum cinerariifolium]
MISKAQLLQEIDGLKHDRVNVVMKVVQDATIKLIQSDEVGILVVKLVKAFMFSGRCAAFEEVANLKEPFVLEKMHGYLPSLKEEFDRARDDLANALYPFLVELTVIPMLPWTSSCRRNHIHFIQILLYPIPSLYL